MNITQTPMTLSQMKIVAGLITQHNAEVTGQIVVVTTGDGRVVHVHSSGYMQWITRDVVVNNKE